MSANSKFLEFITKPGCHLCDEALAVVRPAAARRGLEIIEKSVLDDDLLMERFGLRIPVVMLDGQVVAEGIIDRHDIEEALAGVG